jgi:hypothetical protein
MNIKRKIVLIGEGLEIIERWKFKFETIDLSLENYIQESIEFKIKLDWSSIIKTIFNNSKLKKGFKPEKTLDIYELVDDIYIDHSRTDVQCPGGESWYITISAYKDNINTIKNRLNSLLNYLNDYWIKNGIHIMVLERQNEIQKNQIKELTSNIIEINQTLKSYNFNLDAKNYIINELILIISFIIDSNKLFYQKGPILITKNKKILRILNSQGSNQYTNDLINLLRNIEFDLVEVKELTKDKSELKHLNILQYGMLEQLRGWSQNNTFLESVSKNSIDPNKIREDYINWSRKSSI